MKCQTPLPTTDSLSDQQSLYQHRNAVLGHSDDAPGIYHIALGAASYIGYPTLVKRLLKMNHNVDPTSESYHYGSALWLASTGKYRNALKLLLNHGTDLEAKRTRSGADPLEIARNSGASKTANGLFNRPVQPGYRSSVIRGGLCMTAEDRDIARVDALLRNEAEGNYEDDSCGPALVYVTRGDNTKISKELLAKGAKVNEESSVLGRPLKAAVEADPDKMVELLLGSNADAWESSTIRQHCTPLSAGAILEHENVASYALEREAKIDVSIEGARTPGIDCRGRQKATERPTEWGEVEGYVHMVLAL